MRRLLLAATLVVALPLTAQAGWICDATGQVVEVDNAYWPDAAEVPPSECPPDPGVESMAPQVDVPMPDDPTGFLLDQGEWNAAQVVLVPAVAIVVEVPVSAFDPIADTFGVK